MGDNDVAAPLGRKLLALAPHDANLLDMNGFLERKAGDYPAARKHLEEAVALESKLLLFSLQSWSCIGAASGCRRGQASTSKELSNWALPNQRHTLNWPRFCVPWARRTPRRSSSRSTGKG
jgi:tetratricopeptide (TPR) repeat protein